MADFCYAAFIYAKWSKVGLYAEFHYAECLYTECRGAAHATFGLTFKISIVQNASAY